MRYVIAILALLLLLSLYYYLIRSRNSTKEGFISSIRDDDIYAKLYNTIFNDPAYIQFDCKNILKTIKNNPVAKEKAILDAGTGVGFHYKELSKQYSVVGVDNSEQFLKYARIRNQDGTFKLGDLENTELFKPNTFTHILCSTDTLHHNDLEKIQSIIANFYMWVKPKGIVMIHIFNREKLDPAPREYSQYYHDDKGNRHSLTYYEEFTHDAFWEKTSSDSVYIYNEKVILPSEKVKSSKNVFYIPNKSKILANMKKQGFELIDIYDMKKVDVECFDLYVFRKV
jgi:ubiquinone/menaquinone biosynthesis C-methylase UbiE